MTSAAASCLYAFNSAAEKKRKITYAHINRHSNIFFFRGQGKKYAALGKTVQVGDSSHPYSNWQVFFCFQNVEHTLHGRIEKTSFSLYINLAWMCVCMSTIFPQTIIDKKDLGEQKWERKVWEVYIFKSWFFKYPEAGKRSVRGIYFQIGIFRYPEAKKRREVWEAHFFKFEFLDIQKRERDVLESIFFQIQIFR